MSISPTVRLLEELENSSYTLQKVGPSGVKPPSVMIPTDPQYALKVLAKAVVDLEEQMAELVAFLI